MFVELSIERFFVLHVPHTTRLYTVGGASIWLIVYLGCVGTSIRSIVKDGYVACDAE